MGATGAPAIFGEKITAMFMKTITSLGGYRATFKCSSVQAWEAFRNYRGCSSRQIHFDPVCRISSVGKLSTCCSRTVCTVSNIAYDASCDDGTGVEHKHHLDKNGLLRD
jgi:hypothetical protein